MNADSIHSNAYNFLSAVNTGVDPRTGMYSCSISLPGVAANNLCGPTIGLSLGFSALNPVDAGFGTGWSLATTRYDTVRKRLSLSSGESFLVDDFDAVNDTATFKDRKLRSFDLVRETSGDYRLVHKAGHAEFLTVLPGSEGVAVLHELRSPEGHVVKLDQRAAGGIVKLREIADGTGRVLLSVDYALYETRVTLHPESQQAVSFTFRFTNHWLMGMDLPDGYGDGWVFGYEVRRAAGRSLWRRLRSRFVPDSLPKVELGLLLLKSVTVPTGGREEVTYSHVGHALPGGTERPLSHMPYVTRFVRSPGHEQPDVETRYEYSSHNFFGFGVLDDWLDGEDNLYRVVMPPNQSYEYSSVETLYDGGDPVRTIERTFNRFHLLTREVNRQEGCVREVVTVYDEDPDTSFAGQVPWCQLPIEIRTTYSTYEAGARGAQARSPEYVKTTRYDEDGNVLQATDERGATESFVYYPAEGDGERCPPDPLGFVRFVRQKCIRPPVGTDGPVRLTRYTYQKQSHLGDDDAYHLLPWTETLHQERDGVVGVVLGTTIQTFLNDHGPHHGRPLQTISRHDQAENRVDYAYGFPPPEKDATGVDTPVLLTTTTRTSSNGTDTQCTTAEVARSTLSGLTVMDSSPNGVLMRYAFDALGRQVAETVAANSEFSATTTSTYVVEASGSRIHKRSVTGQETIVELDGFGTAVRVLAYNWNDDGNEREIWRASFDARGRKKSETTTDVGLPVASVPPPYAPGIRVPTTVGAIETTTTYVYDGWDNVTETHGADGVVGYHVVDPVAGVAERWKEADGPEGRIVGQRTRVQRTISGKPRHVDTLEADGRLCHSEYSTYDGLDRLVEQTVIIADDPGAGRVTRYTYDVYDRVVSTTRPDGAVITTEYAGYTDAALVVALRIRHPSLGTDDIVLGRQAYDGLGRRILFQAGQRQTTFHYASSTSASPDNMTLPSGETVAYRYQAHLGDSLLEATSSDGVTTFTHDNTTGDTRSISNVLGTHTIDYDASGHRASETFHHKGVTDEKHCTYRHSLRGVLTEYTDVSGDRHTLIYDALGRFVRMESDDVSVDITYDAVSREQHTLTQSGDGARSMTIDLSFDGADRELERVVTARSDAQVVAQTLSQSYTPDGMLASRRLLRDGDVREETFTYDVGDRLASYTCAGVGAPADESGHPVAGQVFTYDALDNVVERTTTYGDGAPAEVWRCAYSAGDPTQLTSIVVLQGDRQVRQLEFTYDAGGHLQADVSGHGLLYDALGRPAGWTGGDGSSRRHGYDADGRIGVVREGLDERHRYYLAGQLSREEGVDGSSRFHYLGGSAVAQVRTGDADTGTILLGGDSQGSVVAEAGASITTPSYTAHGYDDGSQSQSDIGFTGERRERSRVVHPRPRPRP